MTIEEFAIALREGRTTSAATTDACLAKIADGNAALNAFITVMADAARAQAAQADRELSEGLDRGPLHGVPISIKDLFDIAGTPTTAASRVREGHVATTDAVAITRLEQAGAVIVGKTNLHEFAFGTTNEDSAFGPARHPRDHSRSPGGSSGGSAASVAAGMALATLGTDTGGSIRIPSALCGLVGLKPSLGELSTDGVVPLSKTMDHVGPLTQTVSDAWHMFHALRGDTVVKALSAPDVASLRLGMPGGYFFELLTDDVKRQFDRAVETLSRAGASIVPVEIPHASLTAPVYMHIGFGDGAAYHAHTLDTMPERYTTPVRLRLEMARYVLAEDYVRALSGRDVLRNEVDTALSGVDALLLPTLPLTAWPIGTATIPIAGREEPVRNLTLRLTQLFNVTGHPAMSLPCGDSDAGFPIGLQLVGTRQQTDALLHVARAVEQTLQN